jgi:WD40 repeat protein
MAALGGGAGGTGKTNYASTKTVCGNTAEIYCILLIDEQERIIVTGSKDKTIRVLDAATHELLYVLEGHASSVMCLTYVPATNALVSGGSDGTILFHNLSTRKLVRSLPGAHSDGVYSLSTVPGTTLLVSGGSDSCVKVWDVLTLACKHTLAGHTRSVSTLAIVPGDLVASGSYDGSIRVWNPATGQCVRTIADVHDGNYVVCVLWVPGSDLLASGGFDGRIKLWDVATGKIKANLSEKHASGVRGLAVVPGTTLLASCSFDKSVKIWDGTTGKCVLTLTGHEGFVFGIAVDPSTDSLLSVSNDGTLKVWTNLKAASARRRYCVLACLSRLTEKLNAGEENAAEDEDEGGEGGGQGDGGHLQGVSAFDSITSADVWRYILEFV